MTVGNPIIKHFFTADPTVLVYQDTIYLYTGHDTAPPGVDEYRMVDWLGFSSQDLVHWQDHNILLVATDFDWAKGDAYASKVIEYENKFHWFVSVTHLSIAGTAIGIAVADSPTGPFRDAKGAALVSQNMIPVTSNEKANLDPSVIIDQAGQAYLFWGNGQCYFAKLNDNLTGLDSDIIILDLPGFKEGAHIHYKNGWYYLSYGYEMPEKVAYAMSRNVTGPWDFKGILNDTVKNCETNRPAIIDYKGKSYLFYHNGGLPYGGSHRRSVCVDELHYNPDGTMQKVVMTAGIIEPV